LKSWSDRLIADSLSELTGPDVLAVLMHGTTLASALKEARSDLSFTFFTPEHFFSRTLHSFHDSTAVGGVEQTRISCAADPPEHAFGSAVFPTLMGDSSEVAQEMFQTLHTRLKPGGRLLVSTNNLKGKWVEAQLKALYSTVEIRKSPHGVLFIATRSQPLKKLRGYRARFDFRYGEQLLTCETRPGVFSHRRLDGGARALIRSLHLFADSTEVSDRTPHKIIEMGSGCGAVSVAAATSFPDAELLAVDSDARAVQCTAQSAALNGITRINTLLSSEGAVPAPGTWDLLLGNPPYYSDFRIAELFLQTARKSLRPGGRIHIVTKPVEWQEARMKQLFQNVQAHKFGEYTVFTAIQKG
jgi:16S rRNA (guanine1207-N2)-methyltransferase